MSDDPFDVVKEFDNMFGHAYTRRILGIDPVSSTTPATETAIDAATIMEHSLRLFETRPILVDVPRRPLESIALIEATRRLRLETMFPPKIYHPRLVVALDFDRGPSRHDFWNMLNFFSMLRPLRARRKKAKKRFRVRTVKARNGWKRHLKENRR